MNLSNRQYALHRGVSEGAVRKALKSGRITKERDGKIDPVKADAQWDANTDIAKQRKPSTPATKQKKIPRSVLASVEDTLDESANSAVLAENAYQRAKTALEILKVKIGKIELRVMKGELIDAKTAQRQVFTAARAERDAWLNWPARVSAEWSAELGVDETLVFQELSKAVRDQLFLIAGVEPNGK